MAGWMVLASRVGGWTQILGQDFQHFLTNHQKPTKQLKTVPHGSVLRAAELAKTTLGGGILFDYLMVFFSDGAALKSLDLSILVQALMFFEVSSSQKPKVLEATCSVYCSLT